MKSMIKSIIKKIIPERLLNDKREYQFLKERVAVIEEQLRTKWLSEKIIKPTNQKQVLKLNEYKIYSQNGDDGIINYIFSKIKPTSKTFIEIGIEDGKECNTANLIINFNWKGVLIEGNKKYAEKAREYYKNYPVEIINSFITKENINKVLESCNLGKEVDLFSLDIDGNDYWVWEKIDSINPKVVALEYNSVFGNKSISTTYDPNFDRYKKHESGLYFGASLTALTKLAKTKGYILIGCCSSGVNAFFIRKDLVKNNFKELIPEEAYYENYSPVIKLETTEKQFKKIKNLPFNVIK